MQRPVGRGQGERHRRKPAREFGDAGVDDAVERVLLLDRNERRRKRPDRDWRRRALRRLERNPRTTDRLIHDATLLHGLKSSPREFSQH